jgi:hypothetical protein
VLDIQDVGGRHTVVTCDGLLLMKGGAMKVLGIAGSLRARSNTLQYVDTALNVIEDRSATRNL